MIPSNNAEIAGISHRELKTSFHDNELILLLSDSLFDFLLFATVNIEVCYI
jgi:hypothetical protein